MYKVDRSDDGRYWLFMLFTLDNRLVRVSRHSRRFEALQQAQYLRLHLDPTDREFMKGII